MEVNPLVFETSASTDSAIRAFGVCGCKGMTFFCLRKISGDVFARVFAPLFLPDGRWGACAPGV